MASHPEGPSATGPPPAGALEGRPVVDRSLVEAWRRTPKAELHLHLDGALRPTTALDLARERRLADVSDLDLAALTRRLVAPMPCRDQAELLEAFELPLAILQDAASLERVAHELVLDLAADGIVYAEIRWAPSLHTRRGLRLKEVIEAVARGVGSGVAAASGSSALPAPASMDVRLIAVAMRSGPPDLSEKVARAAAAAGPGLTGFDLAGPEEAFPDVTIHRRAFGIARAAGLGITVHAGEWGGARQVRRALAVGPDRIAHGAPAGDDPALMATLRARGITLDVCPTSNWQAGLVPTLAQHPLPRLVRAGVPVSISTDDPTVSAVSLSEEYARAERILGLSRTELMAMDRHAVRVAFLQDHEPLRARLMQRLEGAAPEAGPG